MHRFGGQNWRQNKIYFKDCGQWVLGIQFLHWLIKERFFFSWAFGKFQRVGSKEDGGKNSLRGSEVERRNSEFWFILERYKLCKLLGTCPAFFQGDAMYTNIYSDVIAGAFAILKTSASLNTFQFSPSAWLRDAWWYYRLRVKNSHWLVVIHVRVFWGCIPSEICVTVVYTRLWAASRTVSSQRSYWFSLVIAASFFLPPSTQSPLICLLFLYFCQFIYFNFGFGDFSGWRVGGPCDAAD